ncbi:MULTISPECIES: hypothetical protein [Variovorax]|uniref:Uncharacterized protein n=1 Tax=Variovorax paradoxus TaxID=34073 RepID=A0A5Q0MD13_VARPD|nr:MULTISPECIES: hypothetical protein [Variovorax]QFZ86534.1 hypothetical protein GFK26_29070 [Variovorax paradoxus]WPG39865.1 hypothetical protein RZE79_11150 [Variovorax boronicumulans]
MPVSIAARLAPRAPAAAFLALLLTASAASAAPVAATVENATTPTACAEEDNVSMVLRGDGIRHMRIEALQPSYLGNIGNDVTAPDFSGCNFDGGAHPTDPAHRFKKRTVVLLDNAQWRIVGMTLPTFWRSARVPVQVGARHDRGFHLLQVFKKDNGKALEAIVLYPSDGYWRLKPLPEARFGDGVYGSSFLLGPVVQAGRPVVNIASIRVVPEPLAIHLRFTDGGKAVARVTEISRTRTALDVTLSKPTASAKQPFAVLRSMYVTPDNADMSEVRWQASPQAAEQVLPLPAVKTLNATQVRFGRSLPSKHNTSAPDIEFSGFDDEAR